MWTQVSRLALSTRQMGLSAVMMAAAGVVLMPATGEAALLAWDNAAQPAYADGWKYGTNGGAGFQPWAGGSAGATIGTIGLSTHAAYPDGTPIATDGKAWNVRGGATVELFEYATRAFTDNSGTGVGTLDVGQSILFDFDYGSASDGAQNATGFRYVGSDGSVRFSFQFARAGWGNNRLYIIGDTTSEIGLGAGERIGVRTAFTLTGPDTYSLQVTYNLANPQVANFEGTLGGTAGVGIETVSLFRKGTQPDWGSNWQYDYNNLSVVPEPTLVGMLGIAGFALIGRRRRA